MKSFKKDANFLYWTLIGSLLFMALMHILNPLIQPPPPDAPSAEKIETVAATVVTLRASEVAPMLRNANDQSTLVFVYASWCGYCKQMMPYLVELTRNNQLQNTKLLFLSIDSRKLQLATYIAQYGYDGAFVPYQVKASAVNSLADVLRATGSSYNGIIPYTVSISASGRMLQEDYGLITQSRILDIAKARANYQ